MSFFLRTFDFGAGLLDAFLAPFLPDESGAARPSGEERERIRQRLWSLRRSLEQLGGGTFFDDLSRWLDEVFGGPDAFVTVVRSWAELVDTLVHAAEADFGSARGRGHTKRRHVKGAVLYLVRQARIDIPKVPAPLEPIVWYAMLDPFIAFIAKVSDRHALWGEVRPTPTMRARVNSGVQWVGGGLEFVVGWLTRIAWMVVFRSSPVSPQLKKAVDRFLRADPRPARTVLEIVTWVTRHAGDLVIVAELFSLAIQEAQQLGGMDAQELKDYAREVVLVFLEDSVGVPPPTPCGDCCSIR